MNVNEFLFQEELYEIKDTILILVDKPWEQIRDEEKVLLSKILGSVKLSMDRVQILYCTGTSIQDLMPYQPAKIISFGVVIQDNSQLYVSSQLHGIRYLSSEALEKLTEASKKNLWLALKQVFF